VRCKGSDALSEHLSDGCAGVRGGSGEEARVASTRCGNACCNTLANQATCRRLSVNQRAGPLTFVSSGVGEDGPARGPRDLRLDAASLRLGRGCVGLQRASQEGVSEGGARTRGGEDSVLARAAPNRQRQRAHARRQQRGWHVPTQPPCIVPLRLQSTPAPPTVSSLGSSEVMLVRYCTWSGTACANSPQCCAISNTRRTYTLSPVA